jgi:hypothetical protein
MEAVASQENQLHELIKELDAMTHQLLPNFK